MSLAQEARERLLSDDERHSGFAITVCAGCGEPAYENPENPDGAGDINHKSECRIVLLERIVAALEAASRLIDRGGVDDVNEWIALARALDDERVLA